MKWRPFTVGGSEYAISDCGRYTVCVVNLLIDGRVTRTYEAWRTPIGDFLGEQLAVRLLAAKEAQQACESHANSSRLQTAAA